MINMVRKNPLNLYDRYCQAWRFLFCCLDFTAGCPFLVAGFVLRFARSWFLSGGGLYDFLNVVGQEPKRKGGIR